MPDQEGAAGYPFRNRLFQARWTLAAAALVLLAFGLGNQIAPLAALCGFAAIAAASALSPERGGRKPPAEPAPAAPDLPEVTARALSEAVGEPLILFGPDGAAVRANRAAREAFDLGEDGADLRMRFRTPEMRRLIDDLVSGAVEPPAIDYAERVPVERWYKVSALPLERAGNIFLLAFRDQSEIRRIDRMRADFIANASHELRTPLASVSGFIEALRGPAKNDPAARERFLEIMQGQTARMARLIDDLLSLSRLEMKAPLRPAGRVELRDIVSGVIDAMAPLASELGVAIDRPPPGPDLLVHGDRDELIQVFENLVENACKYGQSGKRVEIAIEDRDAEVAVAVRDYGPGIAEEHIPRVTERFYRVDVDTSRAQKGTGLGLAIVKHILSRHKATLSIASTPGEGASFTVHIPKT